MVNIVGKCRRNGDGGHVGLLLVVAVMAFDRKRSSFFHSKVRELLSHSKLRDANSSSVVIHACSHCATATDLVLKGLRAAMLCRSYQENSSSPAC
jgi:hypothetical protein